MGFVRTRASWGFRRVGICLLTLGVVATLPVYAYIGGEPRYPGDKKDYATTLVGVVWLSVILAGLILVQVARVRGERAPVDSRLPGWWPIALFIPWLWIAVIVIARRRSKKGPQPDPV
jgi:hypothetical protein